MNSTFINADVKTTAAILALLTTLVLRSGHAHGQDPLSTNVLLTGSEVDQAPRWAFSASGYAYFVPESRDYFQPTLTADRGWLHLEARYNYEALETGSAWVGYNFAGGKKLAWELTPMVGGVFGNLTGFAPGYKGSLTFWKLELYSEGEYVFEAGVCEVFTIVNTFATAPGTNSTPPGGGNGRTKPAAI